MKNRVTHTGCMALVVAGLAASGCGDDEHPFSEIKQEALVSAGDNFKNNEVETAVQGREEIASIVLNVYLKKFRKDETHYAIRLRSYEVKQLGFVDSSDGDVMFFDGSVSVIPQDKEMFSKIFAGRSSWKEDGDALVFDIKIGISGEEDRYRLVETTFPAHMAQP